MFCEKVLNLISYIVIMLSSAGPTKTSDQNRAWKNMKQGKKSCAPTLIWSSSIFGRRRKKTGWTLYFNIPKHVMSRKGKWKVKVNFFVKRTSDWGRILSILFLMSANVQRQHKCNVRRSDAVGTVKGNGYPWISALPTIARKLLSLNKCWNLQGSYISFHTICTV